MGGVKGGRRVEVYRRAGRKEEREEGIEDRKGGYV